VTIGTALPVCATKSPVLRPDTVRGRRAFAELRRSKRRFRTGPVRVQFQPAQEADEARRVAFAVPRKVGTAVERNRCRRRLRAVVAEIAASIPAGAYLVGIDQGVRGLRFQKLRTTVIEAMQRASEGEG
jgi:ribonuclease P protein component